MNKSDMLSGCHNTSQIYGIGKTKHSHSKWLGDGGYQWK